MIQVMVRSWKISFKNDAWISQAENLAHFPRRLVIFKIKFVIHWHSTKPKPKPKPKPNQTKTKPKPKPKPKPNKNRINEIVGHASSWWEWIHNNSTHNSKFLQPHTTRSFSQQVAAVASRNWFAMHRVSPQKRIKKEGRNNKQSRFTFAPARTGY